MLEENDQPATEAGSIQLGSFTVNRMGFGAMRITGSGVWGEPENHDEAISVLKRAVELGVNFIDTADAYGSEVSENLIAEALKPYEEIVIATKGGFVRSGPGRWSSNASPQHLKQACEASLQRLGVETIDLYQLHKPDPNVPLKNSIKALEELQQEGKIKHIGLSNVSVDQIKQAQDIVEVVSIQNAYNIERREHEDVLKYCEQNNLVFIPYFPLGAGSFSDDTSRLLTSIASKYHAGMRQIALAWLLAHSPVTLPIPGTSSVEHLEQNVHASTIKLTSEEVAALDQIA